MRARNASALRRDSVLSRMAPAHPLAHRRSSWFDIDMDGYTNDRDRQLIAGALGTRCPAPGVAARGAAFSPAR